MEKEVQSLFFPTRDLLFIMEKSIIYETLKQKAEQLKYVYTK